MRCSTRSLDDLRAIVANNRDLFRRCYDSVRKQKPDIRGDFVLAIVIKPDGAPKSVDYEREKSQIHEPAFVECAKNAVQALKFPPCKEGFETTVRYPFHFTAEGPPKSTKDGG